MGASPDGPPGTAADAGTTGTAGHAAPGLAEALALLPFERDLQAYLKAEEAELWEWFSSTAFLEERARDVRLELLKAAYRCEREDHAALYVLADEVREAMGGSPSVTLYQAQGAPALNLFLSYLPGEAHVVLEGPVAGTLTGDELRAALAHELAHHRLWEQEGGELLVASQVLGSVAADARAEPSHLETARLLRLYTEVHADRAALAVCGRLAAAVGALIKVETGLADASAESYLRQADEIFGQGEQTTEGVTHPEAFVRTRALRLWHEQGPAAEAEVARLIEGRLDLGRLSLLGQLRLTRLTRRVLCRFLQPAFLRTEAREAHARLFFPDLGPEDDAGDPGELREEVAAAHESVSRYLGYVLLDLATVEGRADEPLCAALRLAEELGPGFPEAVGKELELGKRALTRLSRQAAQVLAAAEARG